MNTASPLTAAECEDKATELRREAREILAMHKLGHHDLSDPEFVLRAIGWRVQQADEWKDLAARMRATR